MSRRPPPGTCKFGKMCKRQLCEFTHPQGRIAHEDEEEAKDVIKARQAAAAPTEETAKLKDPAAKSSKGLSMTAQSLLWTPGQRKAAERLEQLEHGRELELQREAELQAEIVREAIRKRRAKQEKQIAERAEKEAAEELRLQQQREEDERIAGEVAVAAATGPKPSKSILPAHPNPRSVGASESDEEVQDEFKMSERFRRPSMASHAPASSSVPVAFSWCDGVRALPVTPASAAVPSLHMPRAAGAGSFASLKKRREEPAAAAAVEGKENAALLAQLKQQLAERDEQLAAMTRRSQKAESMAKEFQASLASSKATLAAAAAVLPAAAAASVAAAAPAVSVASAGPSSARAAVGLATFREPAPVTELDPAWFVSASALADVTCSMCLMVADAPPSLPCAHVHCRGCLERIPVAKRACPSCRDEFKLSACPLNAFVVQHIGNLQMRCPNLTHGCTVTLTPGRGHRNLACHLTKCAHAQLQCERCGEHVQRQHASRHARSCGVPPTNQESELCALLSDCESQLREQVTRVASQQQELDGLRAYLLERESLVSTLQEKIKAANDKLAHMRSALQQFAADV